MKIKINSHTVFLFPTGLLANGFATGIVCKKLKEEGIILTRKQFTLIIKELRRYKKKHSSWNLVEISEKSGNTVTIRI